MPGIGHGEQLGVQGADHDSEPRHRHAGLDQASNQVLDECLRRRCLPRIADEPIDERILDVLRVAGGGLPCGGAIFEPGIHGIPEKRDAVPDSFGLVVRFLIAPDYVCCRLAARLQRPIRGVALERAMRAMPGLLHQVHAHVVTRKVVDRRQPCLVHNQRAIAVDNALAAKFNADAPVAWFERQVIAHMGTVGGCAGPRRFVHLTLRLTRD